MVVKIYGFNVSTLIVCKELGIPYELIPVQMKEGEHKSKEWITNMHPFGQIPVMIDEDGFKLYEQRAIVRYLVRKYAPTSHLVPNTDDLKKYGLFEQAMSIEAFDFTPHALGVLWERGYKKAYGLETDESAAAEHQKKLEERLDVYDRILEKQKYMAGDELTFADLSHLYCGAGLEIMCQVNALSDSKRPNVARWFADISSRESFLVVKNEWLEAMGKAKE